MDYPAEALGFSYKRSNGTTHNCPWPLCQVNTSDGISSQAPKSRQWQPSFPDRHGPMANWLHVRSESGIGATMETAIGQHQGHVEVAPG